MWEVIQVYDSVGSMFKSWRVGKRNEDGTVTIWAGERTKNRAIAESEAKFWNEKENANDK